MNRFYTYCFGKKVISEIVEIDNKNVTLEDSIGNKITMPIEMLKDFEVVKND